MASLDPTLATPRRATEELWFFTTNLLTRYCYLVTAGHEHVGTVLTWNPVAIRIPLGGYQSDTPQP